MSPLEIPVTGGISSAGDAAAPSLYARRAKNRRTMLSMVGICYLTDAAVLLLYAYAGTTTAAIACSYAVGGLLIQAMFIALSEAGFNDRFKDHYFVMPQWICNLGLLLFFAYQAPEVGCLFICSIFLTLAFGSLRSSVAQMVTGWAIAAIGMTAVFLLSERPITLPHDTSLERLATLLMFVLELGRYMIISAFSSALRNSFYNRGLQLREAYKRIEELAEIDDLTGALNRRSIMRVLGAEAELARTGNTPSCSIALIDLDWFKKINDQFGHPIGDEVLRTFAITVFANIREIDRFGRYGGEEFLLILPGTSRDAATQTVDRVRKIIAELDWHAISDGMSVTISAGVATIKSGEEAESLLTRADTALYKSKHQGRNQVSSS